jgi:hypothetical protein
MLRLRGPLLPRRSTVGPVAALAGRSGRPRRAGSGSKAAAKPSRVRPSRKPKDQPEEGRDSASNEVEVALSFAGDQRAYVDEVARHLQDAGISFFYDQYEETKLWGKDLALHLSEVYRKARYTVVFVSKEYATKAWTRHEFQSALARAVLKQSESILPVRFDETDLPGLRDTIHYLDGRKFSPAELAERIMEKLGHTSVKSVQPPTTCPPRLPTVPPANFNPYGEAELVVKHLTKELTRRSRALEERGFGVHAQVRGERFMLRVLRSGETVYGLDVWIGGGFGDNTICFAVGTRISPDPNTTNGTATIEWDRERSVPVVKMFNMSVLREMGREYRLTGDEFSEEIWEALCEQLERVV